MMSLTNFVVLALAIICSANGFVMPSTTSTKERCWRLHDNMKRPFLDQLLASTLFRWEMNRVDNSSEMDEKGRIGEPMAWSESDSTANRFSQLVSNNELGIRLKQWVADLVAGEYDQDAIAQELDDFIQANDIAMFSFTTCPFCRRAKDALDETSYSYSVLELDEHANGNAMRAVLGKRTGRTSVPNIFVNGQSIGGCNDGPGLLPLMASGEFESMLMREPAQTKQPHE